MTNVRGKLKIGGAPTAAALARLASRHRKKLGATRVRLDVGEELKAWLVDQGLLKQWNESQGR
jgi:hypothetical protein